MAASDILHLLRDNDFLHGISEDALRQIGAVSREVNFAKGSVIFREGDPATKMYLVVKGNVSVEICAPGVGCRRIMTVGDGELLGWSPVLEQSQLTATARALAPTSAIEINASQILAICEHDPRFGFELMRRAARALAKRLNATRLQLMNVYGSQMPESEN
jgi:CRP-like cAMP-binding protein